MVNRFHLVRLSGQPVHIENFGPAYVSFVTAAGTSWIFFNPFLNQARVHLDEATLVAGGWYNIAATEIKPSKAASQFAADDSLLYDFFTLSNEQLSRQ